MYVLSIPGMLRPPEGQGPRSPRRREAKEKNPLKMHKSLLIDTIGHLYNLLNTDPVVFNFSSICYGLKVHCEVEIDEYMENSPPDNYHLCIIVGNEQYIKYSSIFSAYLHITEQDLAVCIAQYPMIKEGDEYLSKPSILLQASNSWQTSHHNSLPPVDLYIGTYNQIKGLNLSKHFDVLINVTQHAYSPYTFHTPHTCAYHHIPMTDDDFFDIATALHQSELIFQQCTPQSKCVVFCDKGCSRSATILLHQLLLRSQHSHHTSSTSAENASWKVDSMLQEVKRIYQKIQPNEGFLCQLRLLHDHPHL
ncbi:hypothetical protein EON65_49810, partial [archaeon]